MSSNDVKTEVIDFLASPRSMDGKSDILDVAPGMSYDEAYRAQFAAKVRQAGTNGTVIGYQASFTSEAAKRLGWPDMPKPYFGTLQLRNWHDGALPLPLKEGQSYWIECETGMRMAAPLKGPGVTVAQARKSVASVHAAFEVVPTQPSMGGRSGQHMVAIRNFGSSCVFGREHGSPELDLVKEPIELFFDDTRVAQAVAGDSGGDPFAVLAEMANTLGRFGRGLEPGMIIMTGSATPPRQLTYGTKRARASFGRLGSVSVSFTEK